MDVRRTNTSVSLGACGLLLVLGTACEQSRPTPATAPREQPPLMANQPASKPAAMPQQPETTPSPRIAETPLPVVDPPVKEPANNVEPMTPRVVPQVAQQNLYSGGQPPLGMPKIALSEQHARACPIKLGQVFPNVTLNDSASQPQELKKFHGKYTLVVVWSVSEPAAVEEFGDLEAYAYQPYKNVGLKVIAVHTLAGKAKPPNEVLKKVQPTFTILHDPNGELWAKVGQESLPRTFLLDGEGRVLWFDIEYSRTTRRQLQQALQAVMQEI